MSRFSYGHLPDHPDEVASDLRHRSVGALLGSDPLRVPEALSYADRLSACPDKGSTSSCVGQAFATSMFLRASIAGTPIARPSAKGIYDVARMVDAPREPLVDAGARPLPAVQGMQDYGVVGEGHWPLTDANVNTPPPLDVFQGGLCATLASYYRIGSGAGSSLLVRRALAKGFVPAFAMDVDSAYEELRQEAYDGPTGPILGGHMQAIVGYGPGVFIVAGSWGAGFGSNGFATLTEGFFERGGATDILVLTIVPTRLK